MKRPILILLFLATTIIANDVINGTTYLLELDKNCKNSKIFFSEKKIPLLKHPTKKDNCFAFIPIKYRTKKGKIELLHVQGKIKEKIVLHVKKGNYKKEKLSVPNSKVKPPKSVQNRIYKEYKEAKKIYNSSTKKLYWNKPFIMPLSSKITSDYGNARIFNGTFKSFHSGTDFRAKVGTPIKASNDGIVVIARDRYYAGGSVVIDHGEGVYSAYYHLSRIDVKVGQKIIQKEVVGLSGKSGRVTGPHLHFSIMLLGEKIDPLGFIKKTNSLF